MLLETAANENLNALKTEFVSEQIRVGDPVALYLDKDEKKDLKIWSYSPFGFEFKNVEVSDFILGEQYSFYLKLGKQLLEVKGVIVSKTDFIVGVRSFFTENSGFEPSKSRRENHRWLCPEVTLPTGSAPNPVRFNDFIFFRVVDVSARGLRIITSLRNKLFAKGQVLEGSFSVPSVGAIKSAFKIERIEIQNYENKPVLCLGVSLVDPDQITLSVLSEYLLTFAKDCSVRALRAEGFPVSQISKRLDFSYVKTLPEYEEVIDLRYKAYLSSGKISPDVQKNFMRDEFDSRSRILIVKHDGKIVGSLRAMFHEKFADTSHSRLLPLPESLPDISECVEVSRACLDPNYRGGDVFDELLAHLALLTIKSGRRYYFGSAAGILVPVWESAGCKKMGTSYVHTGLGDLKHEMLLNDVHQSVLGRTLNAKQWSRLYSDLYEYCEKYNLIEPSPVDQVRRLFRGLRRA